MVEMKDVSMVYQSSQTEALYHVNVTINEGEFVFLVGWTFRFRKNDHHKAFDW